MHHPNWRPPRYGSRPPGPPGPRMMPGPPQHTMPIMGHRPMTPNDMQQWFSNPQGGPPQQWGAFGQMGQPAAPPPTPPKQDPKEIEKQKLTELQKQATQWQKEREWQEYHEKLAQYQQHMNARTDGQTVQSVQKEEMDFNMQYDQWKKQYNEWRDQNKDHPNQNQYLKYESQWKEYEKQMEEKKNNILERKKYLIQKYGIPEPPDQGHLQNMGRQKNVGQGQQQNMGQGQQQNVNQGRAQIVVEGHSAPMQSRGQSRQELAMEEGQPTSMPQGTYSQSHSQSQLAQGAQGQVDPAERSDNGRNEQELRGQDEMQFEERPPKTSLGQYDVLPETESHDRGHPRPYGGEPPESRGQGPRIHGPGRDDNAPRPLLGDPRPSFDAPKQFDGPYRGGNRGMRGGGRGFSPRGPRPRFDGPRPLMNYDRMGDRPRDDFYDGRDEFNDEPYNNRQIGVRPRFDSPMGRGGFGQRGPRGPRFEGSRGPRFEAPRGPRFEAPRGPRFEAPRGPRYEAPRGPGQPFGPRDGHPRHRMPGNGPRPLMNVQTTQPEVQQPHQQQPHPLGAANIMKAIAGMKPEHSKVNQKPFKKLYKSAFPPKEDGYMNKFPDKSVVDADLARSEEEIKKKQEEEEFNKKIEEQKKQIMKEVDEALEKKKKELEQEKEKKLEEKEKEELKERDKRKESEEKDNQLLKKRDHIQYKDDKKEFSQQDYDRENQERYPLQGDWAYNYWGGADNKSKQDDRRWDRDTDIFRDREHDRERNYYDDDRDRGYGREAYNRDGYGDHHDNQYYDVPRWKEEVDPYDRAPYDRDPPDQKYEEYYDYPPPQFEAPLGDRPSYEDLPTVKPGAEVIDYGHGKPQSMTVDEYFKQDDNRYEDTAQYEEASSTDRYGDDYYPRDDDRNGLYRDNRQFDERYPQDRDPYYDRSRDRSPLRDTRDYKADRHSHRGRNSYHDRYHDDYRGQDYQRDHRNQGPHDIDRYDDQRQAPVAPAEDLTPQEPVPINEILCPPGRDKRHRQIVVILRGPPGAGKTYVSKLIRDKEVANKAPAPRTLSLDDYFMVEQEEVVKNPDTGKCEKKRTFIYEYEPEMEATYRSSLLKSFKKNIDDGFFNFIILDAINEKCSHFEEFWSYAKSKGFKVYIGEVHADAVTCEKRNTHKRSQEDIEKIIKGFEETPKHYLRLDFRSLLQDAGILEVVMEDSTNEKDTENTEDKKDAEKKGEEQEGEDDDDVTMGVTKSRWELDTSDVQLEKLDGIQKFHRHEHHGMEDYLELTDDYDSRYSQPGKKRVRWADIESRREQERKRDMGFVVGQCAHEWENMMDDDYADRALNRTKYI